MEGDEGIILGGHQGERPTPNSSGGPAGALSAIDDELATMRARLSEADTMVAGKSDPFYFFDSLFHAF